ncbi:GNAT family N-acetyltransferase [Halobacillus karajensis]|uniref:GNAT family N-acetyltransferase n=1 Tax=Halobacillus karajensis TaxID=195088 RepID=UPI0009DE3C7B|nr:GNAT family N-acetyltransferase [Halobacillus karajensis]
MEIVAVPLDPLHKRKGIGSSLHNKVLDRVPYSTSVLTTAIDNKPAINLYKGKGWKVIKENASVISSDNLQVILGIDIRNFSNYRKKIDESPAPTFS